MLLRLLHPTAVPVAPGFQPTSIRRLFPSPLVFAEMPDDGLPIRADTLSRRILAHERAEPGVVHSNESGWQSDIDFLTWAGDEGKALAVAAMRLVDGLTAHFDGELLRRVPIDWKVAAWANVSRRGAANEAHHHAGCFWSAVYYVDDGGCDEATGGAIEFIDPRGALAMASAPDLKMTVEDCLTAGLVERVYPRTGMLLLFPGWLLHRVRRYAGDGTRISVAINFTR